VNFLPSFALSALVKDHGSDLDFQFAKLKNVNVWWLAEATIGIPLFMKNDRTWSKDSSLDNPLCDSRMIPR
jgi:hypothetical protein